MMLAVINTKAQHSGHGGAPRRPEAPSVTRCGCSHVQLRAPIMKADPGTVYHVATTRGYGEGTERLDGTAGPSCARSSACGNSRPAYIKGRSPRSTAP